MRPEMFSRDELAAQRVNQVIEWPDYQTYMRNWMLAKFTPEENLRRAITMIDSESAESIAQAKTILEGLLRDNPRLDSAYVELARVEMKSNWGAGGLHHAEELLQSALQIRPDSVNAKVLLGYVYAHQQRYAKAEALFTEAASLKGDNLWLWSNWGELLEMEGKPEAAMAKYREATTRPMTHDTYDRARNNAYVRLIEMLKQRSDWNGVESLYKQRLAEFGPGSCYSADYARFMLQQRGDVKSAIDLSTHALNQACNDAQSREVLGLAQYVVWSTTPGEEGAAALNQARLYVPAGPKLLYMLAQSEHTFGAARKLVAGGEEIDQRDNEKLTALSLALQEQNLAAAGRLLKLGARSDAPVGEAGIPAALLPVFEGDVATVRMLRKAGVDYSKLRFQNMSAADVAAQSGNTELIKELDGAGAQL
jgi:tetratricopeptide (TPR) repeat protein